MVVEQFNRANNQTQITDVTSRLFDIGYPGAPWARSGDHSADNKDAQTAGENDVVFCRADVKETPEQRLDQKIKDKFGAEVFEHLKDWDWLIDNKDKLEAGFKKLNGKEAWDIASRISDLSVVDGKSLIYLSKVEGQTRGNLLEKRYDVNLRRGRFRSDDYIGQLYH